LVFKKAKVVLSSGEPIFSRLKMVKTTSTPTVIAQLHRPVDLPMEIVWNSAVASMSPLPHALRVPENKI
jgi:hypothetical protein